MVYCKEQKNLADFKIIKYGSSLRLIYYVLCRAGQLNGHKARTLERGQACCANLDLKKAVEGYLVFLLLDIILKPKIVSKRES